MQHFDIILFENYYIAPHHKIDVILIAHLLQRAGMSCAILDIYCESDKTEIEGIPVIHHHVPINRLLEKKKISKIKGVEFYRFLVNAYKMHKYMKAVMKEVQGWADMFYAGSYHVPMSTVFLNMQKPTFWWGLRSWWMSGFLENQKKYRLGGVRMLYQRYKFKKNPYQKLFVSNEIIKNEHIKLGISPERIIIREERCIESLGNKNYDRLNSTFSFLTIGAMRPQKRLDLSISAFRKLNDDNTRFDIVGEAWGEYEPVISKARKGCERIFRNSNYLEYSDFLEYFNRTHFVVFADIQGKSSVTNGTMLEALIHYRPIIAPDYSPYSDYINKYKIGILYNPQNPDSLIDAMKKAKDVGCESFGDNIGNFLKTIQFDKVSNDLYTAVKACTI